MIFFSKMVKFIRERINVNQYLFSYFYRKHVKFCVDTSVSIRRELINPSIIMISN